MTDFIIVTFPDEASARQGMQVLTDIASNDRFVLRGAGIVTKDDKGRLSMQVLSDNGLRLVAAGTLLGGLAGLSVGLLAAAIMATGGAVSGLGAALTHRGAGERMMEDVARQLQPGSAALVADVETDDVAPLESRMEAVGGTIRHER
jgi:uncharacterized membrane protein